MSKAELRAAQKQDPVIGPTIEASKHTAWLEEKADLIQMKSRESKESYSSEMVDITIKARDLKER